MTQHQTINGVINDLDALLTSLKTRLDDKPRNYLFPDDVFNIIKDYSIDWTIPYKNKMDKVISIIQDFKPTINQHTKYLFEFHPAPVNYDDPDIREEIEDYFKYVREHWDQCNEHLEGAEFSYSSHPIWIKYNR